MPSSKKLGIIAAVFFLCSVLMQFWLFDVIVRIGVRDQTSLKKRNELRKIYLKIPFPLDFNVYFFNVTNPQEVQLGDSPVVNEIGPFSYDEYVEKIDVVDNSAEDSLTYTPYSTFYFNAKKSKGLSGDDTVTIIHPIMVGMVNLVLRDSPVYLSIVNKSLIELFDNPQTIFLTAKVKDILFDGIEINCDTKDFSTNAVCSQIKGNVPGLKVKPGEEKVYLFSLLGPRNATKTQRVKVLRGISQLSDLGRVLEVDGKKELNVWSTPECNRFNGTDGWIFPPLMTEEDSLSAFSPDLCRNVKLNFVNYTTMKGLRVRLYENELGDQTNDEDEKCYCRTPTNCLKKGAFDLSKCMGVPIIATAPHFYKTDESYSRNVKGLHPDEEKHSLKGYFEPMTTCPILAYKRLQFNFDIQQTKKVSQFVNLTNVMFPLLWVEEGVDLEGPILKKIQGIFLMQKIGHYATIVCAVASFVLMLVSLYYYQKNQTTVKIASANDTKPKTKNDSINLQNEHSFEKKIMSGHEFDRY
uniref:Sensory neuron membrane protein 1b n=1 Tax=Sitophilus zeamais TaxID=7047 RepID=A0A5J6MB80_SITZE|nr:sensory neuron membrane protein 1b [Sitophilus zeamais]